jgi:hypothetical protein
MGHHYRKRSSKRLPVHLEAEVIYSDVACVAFVENISDHSVYLKTAHVKHTFHHIPETDVILKIQLQSGRMLYLKCKKIWSDKNTSRSLIERVAMEIIDPPKEFLDFYHTLSHGVNRNDDSSGDTLYARN